VGHTRRLRARSRKGQTRTFSYDPLDRQTNTAYSDGSSIGLGYDNDGNLTSRTDSGQRRRRRRVSRVKESARVGALALWR